MEPPTPHREKTEGQCLNELFREWQTARSAGRGATATQLAERDARLDAEQVVSGGPDAWKHVYTFCDALGPRAIVGLIAGRIRMVRNSINLWAII
jgi:hypothetical protein